MPIHFDETFVEKLLNKKIRLCVIVITCVFLFVFLRLWYLQIVLGGKYNELSTNNRIRITKISAPRGMILSKNRDILVKNIPSFDITLIPQDTQDVAGVLSNISKLLHINKNSLKKIVEKKKGRPPFEPITLKKEVSWSQMSLVLSKKTDLQGIAIDVVPKRLYCYDSIAPHVLGFLGEISREELQKHEKGRYFLGDLIGKYGLEKWGEHYIQGTKGGLKTEVDVFGNRQKILTQIDPVAGMEVYLSIDPSLQKIAEAVLSGKTGAVVAMDPKNGEVKALASSPDFDSNLFSRGIKYGDWESLINNEFHPLLNRALQSQQAPGSVFKIVTVIAALEENLVDPETKIFCPGYYKLGNRVFNCWKKGGHGNMNLKSAIVESCDTYFYSLSLKVGIDNIIKYAKKLGFGMKTGIELEGEKSGFVPTPQWKQKKYGVSWQKGETLNIAIGQGFLLSTPLQIATIFCGLANNGFIPKPRIVLRVEGNDYLKTFPHEILSHYSLSPETFSFVRDALSGVVNEPNGTGLRARVKECLVAGKTGTVQVVSKKFTDGKEKEIPYKLKDHAWFVCFAPKENPKIVVSVFLEHGESGGQFAAPLAGKLVESYLSKAK